MSQSRLAFALIFVIVSIPAAAVLRLDGLDGHAPLGDHDFRADELAPLSEAVTLAAQSGWQAEWNRYGTVHTLQRPGDFLAAGLSGDSETAARAWLTQNRVLFRLEQADVDALELMRAGQLNQSGVRVLLFRQTADGVPMAYDGRIKMAIAGDKLAWVASSSVGSIGEVAQAQITPVQAWLAALNAVPPLAETTSATPVALGVEDGWTLFEFTGFDGGYQRVREGLLALPGAGIHPVFEANVVQSVGVLGAVAYTAYIDAVDGQAWIIQDRVQNLMSGDHDGQILQDDRIEAFEGDYPPGQVEQCGPCHGPYTVAPEEDFSGITVLASTLLPSNDIMIDLYLDDPSCSEPTAVAAHADLLTAPEALVYEPDGGVQPGDYFVNICPFDANSIPPTDYVGTIAMTSAESPGLGTNPKWRHFPVTPAFDHSDDDTRVLGCWHDTEGGAPVVECDAQYVDGSDRAIPWDYLNISTLTSRGNNAESQEAWAGAIVGAGAYKPPAQTGRVYDFPWENTWFNAECDPSVINHAVGNANDIDAAIINLFVQHNRLHDFAYHLGLVETWGTAQTSNYGETGAGREKDPELGMAQAAAESGGYPGYVGRDNANQVTLQDGVAPLTNMYLWQTIGGAAYPPCVDGDFDGQIIAHEYGHLVQNRMTDPDQGLGGQQGRSMGEGWADLNAVMLFDELGLIPDGEPHKFSVGAYVTGDVHKGIRNYPMADSPLMFSDIGYDITCETSLTDPESNCSAEGQVHADSETWTAVLFDLRQVLIEKYDLLGFDSGNALLRRRCAEGRMPADACPGQRRWSQLVHDGMVLQPPTPTMLNARDAILAADLARAGDPEQDWESNQQEIWEAFARRGFGAGADISGAGSTDATGGWDSPLGGNVEVRFGLRDPDENPVAGEVYIGRHEARSTPAADTDPESELGNSLLMQPGSYEVFVRADGFGHSRFNIEVAEPGPQAFAFQLVRNLASAAAGAVAGGDGERPEALIDETEATNWESTGNSPSVDEARPAVTVALAGGTHEIARVQVSGMLQVTFGEPPQNRFSALHQFALEMCDADTADCQQDENYTEVYVSPDGAFTSGPFRPISPDMTLREFVLPAPVSASHVRVIALHNKCTGAPFYQGYLGEPGRDDADPANNTDCRVANPPLAARNTDVRIAELQVFGSAQPVVISDHIFSDRFEP